MDSVILFLSNIFMTTGFVAFMFFVAIITDYNQSKNDNFGWAVFFTITAIACSWSMITINLWVLAVVAACWIPVGILWAFLKWKLRIDYVRYNIQSKGLPKNSPEYNRLAEKLNVDNVKSNIAYWILFFPISIVSTCLFNVFESIEYLVTVKLGGKFKSMAAKAFE